MPGAVGQQGALTCYITPPDPGDLVAATGYLWPATGEEKRLTTPRAGGPNVTQPGWKMITHRVEFFLAWTGSSDDPAADTNFPAVVDAVMAALRPSADEVHIRDPVTGIMSSLLLGIGEDMTYTLAPVHSLADQAYLRYDAKLTITVIEYFQS